MHKFCPLALLIGFLILATPNVATADPLSFSNVGALQNNNTTVVDLFGNPGVTLIAGQQLTFRVDVTGTLPPGTTNTLSITYQAAGSPPVVQTFEIPLFGFVDPPFTHLFTIQPTGSTPDGVDATLTIDILGSNPDFVIPSGPNAGQSVDSFTYSFRVAQPVPEPASLALLGAGMLGVASRIRRKFERKP